jgi:hypothetical protein
LLFNARVANGTAAYITKKSVPSLEAGHGMHCGWCGDAEECAVT